MIKVQYPSLDAEDIQILLKYMSQPFQESCFEGLFSGTSLCTSTMLVGKWSKQGKTNIQGFRQY